MTLGSDNKEFKISLQPEKTSQVKAMIWNDICDANDEGDEISNWLTNELGKYNGSQLRPRQIFFKR